MIFFKLPRRIEKKEIRWLALSCGAVVFLVAIALALSGRIPLPEALKLAISNINKTAATANTAAVAYWNTYYGAYDGGYPNPLTDYTVYAQNDPKYGCGAHFCSQSVFCSDPYVGAISASANGQNVASRVQNSGSTGSSGTNVVVSPGTTITLDYACQPYRTIEYIDGSQPCTRYAGSQTTYYADNMTVTGPGGTVYSGSSLIGSATTSVTGAPGTTQNYTLTCKSGASTVKTVTVPVKITTAVLSLSANPTSVLTGTGTSTLAYEATNVVAGSCSLKDSAGVPVIAGLGTDASSAQNNWAANNFASTDQLADTPTNSFMTVGPLGSPISAKSANVVLSSGNLRVTGNGSAGSALSTSQISAGLWYWEQKPITVGVFTAGVARYNRALSFGGSTMSGWWGMYYDPAQKLVANAASTCSAPAITASDIAQVAVDASSPTSVKLWIGKNNTWYDSACGTTGNPAAGLNPTATITAVYLPVSPYFGIETAPAAWDINFGQGGQSGLSYFSAAGGSFRYAPPSGYKALSTKNLPAPTIATPSSYFDALAYAGTGGTQSVVGLGFQPDLVWIKNRDTTNWHVLTDSVRGVLKSFFANSNSAETSSDTNGSLSAFLSNGFTVSAGSGNAGNVNAAGNNYVSFNWKESPTAGFDIVPYTGNGATSRTIPHALGVAPEFSIVKSRTVVGDPYVWHALFGLPRLFAKLDSTAAPGITNTPWTPGSWTAASFQVSTNATNNPNAAGVDYIAYLFRGVEGFSKFGQYTGNSSTDGPFIYTGFKPRLVMIRPSGIGNWALFDSARTAYNPVKSVLYTNLSNAEPGAADMVDFVSNGFKFRGPSIDFNEVGDLFYYAAFAEDPFKSSAQPYNLVLDNSVRFTPGSGTYLSRTPSVAGDRQKWTISAWVKRAGLGSLQDIFSAGLNTNDEFKVQFDAGDTLRIEDYSSGAYQASLVTVQAFRDPAAWVHVALVVDTTQATPSNRIKLYVDGSLVTLFSTATYPAQNYSMRWNQVAEHDIGRLFTVAGRYFDGHMSDVYFVDGQALSPTSFGESDPGGYWRPKAYSGTYGTNGFHLDFADTSSGSGSDSGTKAVGPFSSAGTKTYTYMCTSSNENVPVAVSTGIEVTSSAVSIQACNSTGTSCSSGATPATLSQGEQTNLSWSALGMVEGSCNVRNSANALVSPAATNVVSTAVGSSSTQVPTTFTLSCTPTAGGTATSSASITMADLCANMPGYQASVPANCSQSGLNCTANSGYVVSGSSCVANSAAPSGIALTATRVRPGTASILSWTVSGMTAGVSCSMSPALPGGMPAWNSTNPWYGSAVTGAITQSTRYTMTCGTGTASTSASVAVPLIPTFQEI